MSEASALKELLDEEATEEELAEARELDETWFEALEAGTDSGTSELGAVAGDETEEVGTDSDEPSDEIAGTVFKASLEDNVRRGDVWGASGAENDPVLRTESNQALIQLSYTINSCSSRAIQVTLSAEAELLKLFEIQLLKAEYSD